MNRKVVINAIRFVVLLLLQVLLFRRMSGQMIGFSHVHFFIYPLFILLLPIRIPSTVLLLLAFVMGISVDVFYNSPGVHAAALVLLAYIRPMLIRFLEPYEGYNVEDSPTMATMGFAWFVPYVAISMLVFLFVYFSVEAFTFVYLFDIVIDTIFSFIASFVLIIIVQFLFRSKY